MSEILDTVGLATGAFLTLMIFSYLLGDNPLHRLALHLFVGALLGYSLGIILRDVLYETVVAPLRADPLSAESQITMFFLLLSVVLLFKLLPRTAYIGNFSVAYLVGVGSAVALSGALLGTLVPQIGATGRALSFSSLVELPNGLLVVAGTVCTLMAFTFSAREGPGLAGLWNWVVRIIGGMFGRGFLIFALGVAFAGALTASLSIFIGRIQYIIDAVTELYFRMMGS
jgi:hypothetical protein